MYRFLLYSLILHSLIIALLFASTIFTPKPKNIQIKLAVLPKSNSVQKASSKPPVEQEKPKPKKLSPEEEKKKAEQLQKLLDNVLKEDIKAKEIEKPKQVEQKKPEVKKQSKPKEAPFKPVQTPAKPTPVEKPKITEQPIKSSIAQAKEPAKEEAPIKKIETPNPYSNPVLPKEDSQNNNKQENNPYDNPVLPTEPIKNEAVPIEAIPSLPPAKPARKEIDASAFKDNKVGEEASRIANDSITKDIMSDETFYLSSSDKKALMNQMSQCLASLGVLREKEESVTLLIEMKEDAKIKDINVIKNNKIIPKQELNNLESRIIYLFNNPKCSKLILPEGKFNYWKKFTIKLNLKGLFD